jgi:hypothetical protein
MLYLFSKICSVNRSIDANQQKRMFQTDLSHLERYFENNHNSQIILNTSDINTKSEDGEATALTNVWRYIYNLHIQPEEGYIIPAMKLSALKGRASRYGFFPISYSSPRPRLKRGACGEQTGQVACRIE